VGLKFGWFGTILGIWKTSSVGLVLFSAADFVDLPWLWPGLFCGLVAMWHWSLNVSLMDSSKKGWRAGDQGDGEGCYKEQKAFEAG